MWQGGPRDSIGYRLCFHGLWHAESWPLVVPFLLNRLLTARVFLDVGANTGLFSVAGCASNPNLRGLAIEALPEQAGMLRRNLALNGFQSRIGVRQCAVCDQIGEISFHQAQDNTMGSLNTAGYKGQPGTIITVPSSTLDRVLEEEGVTPDLVKIDVEGFEDIVLSGADKMLSLDRPELVIEVNPGKDCQMLREIFRKHRYSVACITKSGLKPYPEIEAAPEGSDWLCTPIERA